ncbi:MAG: PDZ domain-containing protein [Ignavibacteriales bacterium]|nr:PDZ domain-containing protein [Ignavibacteriales bacterium]
MKQRIILALVLMLGLSILPNPGWGQIKKEVIKIESKGKQGYLGVQILDVNKKLKDKKNLSVERGAFVQEVVDDSPAEEAGIEKGDVILKFADEMIDDGEDLTDAVRATKPKTEVSIEVNRNGEKKTIKAVIGKMKTPQAYAFNFDDEGMKWSSPSPNISNLRKKLNIRVFSESEFHGAQMQSLTKQLGEYFGAPSGKGLLVTEVEKSSEAEKAGFKAGDVITKANGNKVKDVGDLQEEISDSDGKSIPIEIMRDKKSLILNMKIEKEDDEYDDDEWSGNIIVSPGGNCAKSSCIQIPSHRVEKGHLQHKLHDLRKGIEKGMLKIKQAIRREFQES